VHGDLAHARFFACGMVSTGLHLPAWARDERSMAG
jgi:hypothetical protein